MGKTLQSLTVGDLAATPELCLDNIEESSLLAALEIADIDGDGLLDEAEFSAFVAGESATALFEDLYHPAIAGPLRAVFGGTLLVLGTSSVVGATAVSLGLHGGGASLTLPDYTLVEIAENAPSPDAADESAIVDAEEVADAPAIEDENPVTLRLAQELADTARAELDRFRPAAKL